jgi:hypothetical protein
MIEALSLCTYRKWNNGAFIMWTNHRKSTGGFEKLVDLKQHFVKLKGDNANVQIVSQAELHAELERAGMLPVLH